MGAHVLSVIAATTFGAIAVSYITYYIKRKKHLLHPPKDADWKLIGVVEEISVFPVRSAASVLLNEAHCKIDGLYSCGIKDRFLMLYHQNGNSVSAGAYPKMLSIKTEVRNKNTLILKAPSIESLTINLEKLKSKQRIIKHKQGFKLYLVEGELEHYNWFSRVILDKTEGIKLYVCLKTKFEYNFIGEDKSIFMPIMVMNNASVNDLNQRLSAENKVHHLQFRGNILIKSCDNVKPYDEDKWSWLRFGEDKEANERNCILRYKAPCLRCILPNVDIHTCKRNSNFEPLRTLRKYRLVHNIKEPTLGAYYKVFQEGIIKRKDPIYAIVA